MLAVSDDHVIPREEHGGAVRLRARDLHYEVELRLALFREHLNEVLPVGVSTGSWYLIELRRSTITPSWPSCSSSRWAIDQPASVHSELRLPANAVWCGLRFGTSGIDSQRPWGAI